MVHGYILLNMKLNNHNLIQNLQLQIHKVYNMHILIELNHLL